MADEQNQALLEAALEALDPAEFGDLLPIIREVVGENLRRGRAQKFLQPDDGHSLVEYVGQVARTMRAEAGRLRGLDERADGAWELLQHHLRMRAYVQLSHKGLDQAEAYARADDFAQETCMALLKGRYPGDVPYAAWAERVLKNIIIQGLFRGRDALDHPAYASLAPAIDGQLPEDELLEEVEDPRSADPLDQAEWRADAHRALAWLDCPLQREVLMNDLDGKTDAEIAARLGRSVQAVYNLRHRARHALRARAKSGRAQPGAAPSP